MTFGEKCFEALADARRSNGNKITREEWVGIVNELFARHKTPAKKRASMLTDDEWIASLESEPCLAGVDIRGQLAHAQFWCKNNSRKCSRRFFINWLNKADRTISNPGGKQVTISKDVYKEPEGWRTSESARRALKLSEDSWALLVAKDWFDISTDIRASILKAL